jgi:hypothetical protein
MFALAYVPLWFPNRVILPQSSVFWPRKGLSAPDKRDSMMAEGRKRKYVQGRLIAE